MESTASVTNAVDKVLDEGYRTADLVGRRKIRAFSTQEIQERDLDFFAVKVTVEIEQIGLTCNSIAVIKGGTVADVRYAKIGAASCFDRDGVYAVGRNEAICGEKEICRRGG